jgi:hypothetical protein
METRKKEILEELEEKFKALKEELKLKSSFEDIEGIFYVRDAVLGAGFVSENFSRQLCSRIVDTLMSWGNYLHGMILPNPQNLMNTNESKMFEEDERKEMLKLMSRVMAWVSTNTLAGLTKEKVKEKEFIDGSVGFWKNTFKPKLAEFMKKVNEKWKEK